jgi:hypothetical protein
MKWCQTIYVGFYFQQPVWKDEGGYQTLPEDTAIEDSFSQLNEHRIQKLQAFRAKYSALTG